MGFDPGGGGGQGGWNPGGNPPGAGGPWGAPQPGAPQQPQQPQQGGWGQPQQPQQPAPGAAWGQPQQPAAPQQPQQGAWGAPQGAPQQPQQAAWGAQQPQAAPQQPGYGQPQAAPQQQQGAWGQQAGAAFGQAAGQLATTGAAAAGGPAPTNPWFPAALVSFFFPGLGLLLLKDKDRKKLAIAIFGGFWAIWIVLAILTSILVSVTESVAIAGIFSLLRGLVSLAFTVGSLIFTHDETVKAYPHLGQPIFFKNPVNLPAALQ